MKPILFNTEMVRAILDGRKMQTRRVVKPQHLRVLNSPYHQTHPDVPDKTLLERLCYPPYNVGNSLYVRETWFRFNGQYVYRATAAQPELWDGAGMWHPSIHMPKEAARLFLRVTDVRAERLQEITAEGTQAEGIRCYNVGMGEVAYSAAQSYEEAGNQFYDHPVWAFAGLWDSTIKPEDRDRYGWAANPWVWVICFERCEKPEDGDGDG